MRNAVRQYMRFLESLEADSRKGAYELPILRDLAALPDAEYDTFSKKIEYTVTKYTDAENFALAQLRTIMGEEGFCSSASLKVHPRESDAMRSDFANAFTSLRDASCKYGRLEAFKLAADRWDNNFACPTPQEQKHLLLSAVWELT